MPPISSVHSLTEHRRTHRHTHTGTWSLFWVHSFKFVSTVLNKINSMMATSIFVYSLVRLSLLSFGLWSTDPQEMVAKLRKAKDGARVSIFPRLKKYHLSKEEFYYTLIISIFGLCLVPHGRQNKSPSTSEGWSLSPPWLAREWKRQQARTGWEWVQVGIFRGSKLAWKTGYPWQLLWTLSVVWTLGVFPDRGR